MIDWHEFWSATSVVTVVGWALGILGIIAFLVKSWPLVKRFVAFVDALFSLPAFIERTDARIAEIHHEVNYNNGSSVKDGVHRVEIGVKGLYPRMDAVEAAAAQLRNDLEETQERHRKETE